jgi:hypothetical protein
LLAGEGGSVGEAERLVRSDTSHGLGCYDGRCA